MDDGFMLGASPAAFFLNDTIWYSSFLFFKKKWGRGHLNKEKGSSPDIWLSS